MTLRYDDKEFTPGDVVRVKTHEELCNEYGKVYPSDVYIDADRCWYVAAMGRIFGGNQYTIRSIVETPNHCHRIMFSEGNSGWAISPGMIVPGRYNTDIDQTALLSFMKA